MNYFPLTFYVLYTDKKYFYKIFRYVTDNWCYIVA